MLTAFTPNRFLAFKKYTHTSNLSQAQRTYLTHFWLIRLVYGTLLYEQSLARHPPPSLKRALDRESVSNFVFCSNKIYLLCFLLFVLHKDNKCSLTHRQASIHFSGTAHTGKSYTKKVRTLIMLRQRRREWKKKREIERVKENVKMRIQVNICTLLN